jgi:hypothetical protein
MWNRQKTFGIPKIEIEDPPVDFRIEPDWEIFRKPHVSVSPKGHRKREGVHIRKRHQE